VAFFAHVDGFIFGVITARVPMNVGRAQPQDYDSVVGAPA
jgi:membrane associated rhomboid family serine protease